MRAYSVLACYSLLGLRLVRRAGLALRSKTGCLALDVSASSLHRFAGERDVGSEVVERDRRCALDCCAANLLAAGPGWAGLPVRRACFFSRSGVGRACLGCAQNRARPGSLCDLARSHVYTRAFGFASSGLTPARTLNSILNVECKRPNSRFTSYRSGYFGLKVCADRKSVV